MEHGRTGEEREERMCRRKQGAENVASAMDVHTGEEEGRKRKEKDGKAEKGKVEKRKENKERREGKEGGEDKIHLPLTPATGRHAEERRKEIGE